MSGCLDNAHCPQIECPDLSEKRNQIASIVAGGLVCSIYIFIFSIVTCVIDFCSFFKITLGIMSVHCYS